jgi:hypothetical protein
MKFICPKCGDVSEQETEGLTCNRCLFDKKNPQNVTLVLLAKTVQRNVSDRKSEKIRKIVDRTEPIQYHG